VAPLVNKLGNGSFFLVGANIFYGVKHVKDHHAVCLKGILQTDAPDGDVKKRVLAEDGQP
jgi:hypothetical protein